MRRLLNRVTRLARTQARVTRPTPSSVAASLNHAGNRNYTSPLHKSLFSNHINPPPFQARFSSNWYLNDVRWHESGVSLTALQYDNPNSQKSSAPRTDIPYRKLHDNKKNKNRQRQVGHLLFLSMIAFGFMIGLNVKRAKAEDKKSSDLIRAAFLLLNILNDETSEAIKLLKNLFPQYSAKIDELSNILLSGDRDPNVFKQKLMDLVENHPIKEQGIVGLIRSIFRSKGSDNEYELLLLESALMFKIGDMDNAIKTCESAIEKNPSRFEAHQIKSILLLFSQEFQQSFDYLNKEVLQRVSGEYIQLAYLTKIWCSIPLGSWDLTLKTIEDSKILETSGVEEIKTLVKLVKGQALVMSDKLEDGLTILNEVISNGASEKFSLYWAPTFDEKTFSKFNLTGNVVLLCPQHTDYAAYFFREGQWVKTEHNGQSLKKVFLRGNLNTITNMDTTGTIEITTDNREQVGTIIQTAISQFESENAKPPSTILSSIPSKEFMFYSALLFKSLALWRVGRKNEVKELQGRLFTINFYQPHRETFMGVLSFLQGFDKFAIEYFDTAQSLAKDHRDLYPLIKGLVSAYKKKENEALKFINQGKNVNPDSAVPYYCEALILERFGRLTKTKTDELLAHIILREKNKKINLDLFGRVIKFIFDFIVKRDEKARASDTRLMSAVRTHNANELDKLVSEDEDINATNELGENALGIALETVAIRNNIDLFAILLGKRKRTSMLDFDKFVDECVLKCQAKSDEERKGIIDKYVAKLTQARSHRYRTIEHTLSFLAHGLGSLVGGDLIWVDPSNEMEVHRETVLVASGPYFKELAGSFFEPFLQYRLDINFRILIDRLLNHSRRSKEEAQFNEDLKQEILLTLETYRSRMDADILRLYSAAKSSPDLYVRQAWNFLANAHVTNVYDKIKSLKDGEEFCCATGHIGHSIYVSFQRKNPSTILCRVDNLGAGINVGDPEHAFETNSVCRHPCRYNFLFQEFTYQPCYFEITIANEEDVKKFKDYYLKMILSLYKESRVAYKLIYKEKCKNLSSPASEKHKTEYLPLQLAGNCTMESHNVGRYARRGKDFYDKLLCLENEYALKHAQMEGTRSLMFNGGPSRINTHSTKEYEAQRKLQISDGDFERTESARPFKINVDLTVKKS